MPKLDWENVLKFNTEPEYYETLGFLCKEEEVVRVYIEHNELSGARGSQGRLRVRKGNFNYFPEPLKKLFCDSVDGKTSETQYVRNLRDEHHFIEVQSERGKGQTYILKKNSLAEVKSTVPKQFLSDFMRGYLWNYTIDTRVIKKKDLLENAENKNIQDNENAKTRILANNERIGNENLAKKKQKKYDIFLSHSYIDQIQILSLIDLFNEAEYSVYVDWIEDSTLDRTNVTFKTANMLKKRMNVSQGLAYVATENSTQSKWCPWELGYFDGKSKSKCCILPIMEPGEFNGQEYLGVYPYLRYDIVDGDIKKDFWVYNARNDTHIRLREWLEK